MTMHSTEASTQAYIGLGSNLESPLNQVKLAIKTLQNQADIEVEKVSSLYASTPQGPQDQPDYVNAVAKVVTTLSAQQLLQRLQSLETEQGKVKKRHWGERLIDLDILLFGTEVIDSANLTVPHREMIHRDFVLLPLQEIEPELEIPQFGSIHQAVQQLSQSFVKPWSAE